MQLDHSHHEGIPELSFSSWTSLYRWKELSWKEEVERENSELRTNCQWKCTGVLLQTGLFQTVNKAGLGCRSYWYNPQPTDWPLCPRHTAHIRLLCMYTAVPVCKLHVIYISEFDLLLFPFNTSRLLLVLWQLKLTWQVGKHVYKPLIILAFHTNCNTF